MLNKCLSYVFYLFMLHNHVLQTSLTAVYILTFVTRFDTVFLT